MTRTLADWLQTIERIHPRSIDMGLDRIRVVAQALKLGPPGKAVITVGGTNGKGSTVAFIESIARAAGWKVGAYTSPHLLAYNERVRIDGADAPDDALIEAFEAIEAARGDTPLTYFEYGTLAALWRFERAGLDLAILEVGLGGRLDATNLVDADVAVITTVDLDHQDYLGDDREQIGAEKVGIARAWKPLVLGDDDPPSSVLGHAYRIGAPTWRIANDFFFKPLPPSLDAGGNAQPSRWQWREIGKRLELPVPQLAAPVQLRNAAVAIAALRSLKTRPKPLPQHAYADGIANAHVGGRLQRFERDGVEVVVDVGHNPQAARALADWLRAAPTPGRVIAVYAALSDKDVAGVVEAVAPVVDRWHLAGLADAGPRGGDVAALAARLAGTAAADGTRHADVAQALHAARAEAKAGDRVLVFGSFHTAASALESLARD
ncbi:bifunctional tetrahydrofolate synthase/dihydrofolate synthase [Lysobacter auxotrophicus]|uniref:Dihydrofolate synthase/folylpolyglutamate synthase n=1 Tax=Lysobacter auxotrophicus TaxID=2992573 RepID=A0ABM8DB69_9GAMM|nr:bifunctional tetrahydrofolate synthase/dihydrofolate synthase [Lysobacter auxotrophicus]BDU15813.1 bifunctional tetrahydrofolate synthase/dihydrofolate synthase [Lysobacter auxotrophicus]